MLNENSTKKGGIFRQILEWATAVLIALVVYFFIRACIFRTANVSGNSMEPTLLHGQIVFINRLSYLLSKPKKGDIIAFPYNEDRSKDYVKRIIGLPGDVIDLRDFHFYVNNEILDDDFSKEMLTAFGDVSFPLTVPENTYFVLGDNRNVSNDSRYSDVGCIDKKDIIGKVSFVIWPLSDVGGIK